ncbi:hypothetical protein BRD01_01410 [Halobacteriales archaeon QS_8_65_32]|nr:MAG: hypothetical protein BRD01_01410 [Halobacteriales archaeon QS_8_65_32]
MDECKDHGLSDEAVHDAFLRAIESDDRARKRFREAEFGDLDLNSFVLDSGDNEPIVFEQATIHGLLNFSRASVRQPLEFSRCTFNTVQATDAEFDYELRFPNATFHGDVDFVGSAFKRGAFFRQSTFDRPLLFGGTEFNAAASFRYATFRAVSTFRDVGFGQASFNEATFETSAQFSAVTFRGRAEFTMTEFASSATFEGVRALAQFDFSPNRVGRSDFSDSSFENIDVAIGVLGGSRRVSLRDTTIETGRLGQPSSDGRVAYDLTGARLGDVTLDLPTPGAFDRYRRYLTDFGNFQFVEYREALRDHRWKIHEYVEPTETTTTDLELTYLKAKRGASSVGDSDDAAHFFVREMRYRRRRYRERTGDPSLPVRDRLGALSRWFTNGFLALVAGYGERPQRVIATAISVVLTSALLYPFEWVGGVRTADGVYLYGNRPTLAAELAAFAYDNSLYFSVVTFTTLGYGDSSPAGGLARLLASAEAVSDAFFAALFVFALGRRVTR